MNALGITDELFFTLLDRTGAERQLKARRFRWMMAASVLPVTMPRAALACVPWQEKPQAMPMRGNYRTPRFRAPPPR
jgi:hypothetical protein